MWTSFYTKKIKNKNLVFYKKLGLKLNKKFIRIGNKDIHSIPEMW